MSIKNIPQKMFQQDAFSQWMGMEVTSSKEGFSVVELTVRKEMTNGFNIAHGGITYSLADSALAFASNSMGSKAVSIETSISHIKPVNTGDRLVATAELKEKSKRLARFDVEVRCKNERVALFHGTVFITEKKWE